MSIHNETTPFDDMFVPGLENEAVAERDRLWVNAAAQSAIATRLPHRLAQLAREEAINGPQCLLRMLRESMSGFNRYDDEAGEANRAQELSMLDIAKSSGWRWPPIEEPQLRPGFFSICEEHSEGIARHSPTSARYLHRVEILRRHMDLGLDLVSPRPSSRTLIGEALFKMDLVLASILLDAGIAPVQPRQRPETVASLFLRGLRDWMNNAAIRHYSLHEAPLMGEWLCHLLPRLPAPKEGWSAAITEQLDKPPYMDRDFALRFRAALAPFAAQETRSSLEAGMGEAPRPTSRPRM